MKIHHIGKQQFMVTAITFAAFLTAACTSDLDGNGLISGGPEQVGEFNVKWREFLST